MSKFFVEGSVKLLLSSLQDNEIFLSEDDLKFSLARLLEKCDNVSNVIVEYPILASELYQKENEENDDCKGICYIDIYFEYKRKKHFIELKYKTKECKVVRHNINEFDLKEHGAISDNLYRIYKDIKRMERIKEIENGAKSYCFILTNEPGYWSPHNKSGTNISKVSLEDGKSTKEIIQYDEKDTIEINNSYNIEWIPYKNIENTTFKYLLIDMNT